MIGFDSELGPELGPELNLEFYLLLKFPNGRDPRMTFCMPRKSESPSNKRAEPNPLLAGAV